MTVGQKTSSAVLKQVAEVNHFDADGFLKPSHLSSSNNASVPSPRPFAKRSRDTLGCDENFQTADLSPSVLPDAELCGSSFLPSVPKMPRRLRMGRTGPTDREWWRFYADQQNQQGTAVPSEGVLSPVVSAVVHSTHKENAQTEFGTSFQPDALAELQCGPTCCCSSKQLAHPVRLSNDDGGVAVLTPSCGDYDDPCTYFLRTVSNTLERFKLDGAPHYAVPFY